jgi:hypothetical protein
MRSMIDVIQWKIKAPTLAELAPVDVKWTDFCQVVTKERHGHGTAKIIIAALNQMQDGTLPVMEYRLKEGGVRKAKAISDTPVKKTEGISDTPPIQ